MRECIISCYGVSSNASHLVLTQIIWPPANLPPVMLDHLEKGRMFVLVGQLEEWAMQDIDKPAVIATLNHILEQELAGVVRYTHYSLLVFGFGRIPIVSWLRTQADESLLHAQQAGEMITMLGDYPSLGIGPLLDSHTTDISTILRESLESERVALALYRDLMKLVEGRSVVLEEYARQMIYAEELHASDVDKMLRKPGDVAAFAPAR